VRLRDHVIGIDPSITATAIATWQDWVDVRGSSKGGDGRLHDIYVGVKRAARHYNPDGALAIVEDLPTHAHGAGITGMAQGVVRLALIDAKVPYVTVPAATVKAYATGKGNATKADMRMAWFKRTGDDERNDNIVDALWLRQIGLDAVGDDTALPMPKAQRERLFKVQWPPDIAARLLEPYERVVQEVAP
jgi:Holliday junction resolvasome RuvABC endonuclease subunit